MWTAVERLVECKAVKRLMEWIAVERLMEWTAVERLVEWTAVERLVEWTAVKRLVEWTAVERLVEWTAVERLVEWTAVELMEWTAVERWKLVGPTNWTRCRDGAVSCRLNTFKRVPFTRLMKWKGFQWIKSFAMLGCNDVWSSPLWVQFTVFPLFS